MNQPDTPPRRPAPRRQMPRKPAPRPVDSARQVAYDCLRRIDHHGAYANLVLGPSLERSGLDVRDRRFVTELVYGTVRMRRACDALIDRFVSAAPEPDIRSLLRLGTYQLAFAGVATHAAVAETVSMAPKRLRGFVNAVLRRVATTPIEWPNDAVRLSYPDWMVARLTAELGAHDAVATLTVMNEAPDVTERADGYVQDLASQWTAAAVGAGPGEVVLDVCAAPGGKATAMAADGAFVVAADSAAARVGLITANVARLGSAVASLVADGTRPPFAPGAFDRVLLDAPCSGLGSLRRRADARWRITEQDVVELAELQRRLLVASAELVRPGGTLVYSVCTLLAAESIDHPVPVGFEAVTTAPDGPWQPWGSGFRLLPHLTGTDGMVLVRYRRTR
ncbi:MAG: putative rRNA methyltransferase [Ilumatobacteraceae bacterium]|nr:putative rRNA methyltransferase [Ilumatobacteraceae bacterium]